MKRIEDFDEEIYSGFCLTGWEASSPNSKLMDDGEVT
jgi:hypothetical protein